MIGIKRVESLYRIMHEVSGIDGKALAHQTHPASDLLRWPLKLNVIDALGTWHSKRAEERSARTQTYGHLQSDSGLTGFRISGNHECATVIEHAVDERSWVGFRSVYGA